MYHHRIVITLATIFIGVAVADNSLDDHDDAPWSGVWFPKNPAIPLKEQFEPLNDRSLSAFIDNEDTLQMAESKFNVKTEYWKGAWFPAPPGQSAPMLSESVESKEVIQDDGLTKMGISNFNCDDGMTNLHTDYDPRNISHHSKHLCLDERKLYAPSYDVSPRLLDYTIPTEYVALHKCMDEVIEYDDAIPTL